MCESRSGERLAVAAVAYDGAFGLACDGEVDAFAEAGCGDGCLGHVCFCGRERLWSVMNSDDESVA